MTFTVAPRSRAVTIAPRSRAVRVRRLGGLVLVFTPGPFEIPKGALLDTSGKPELDTNGDYIVLTN